MLAKKLPPMKKSAGARQMKTILKSAILVERSALLQGKRSSQKSERKKRRGSDEIVRKRKPKRKSAETMKRGRGAKGRNVRIRRGNVSENMKRGRGERGRSAKTGSENVSENMRESVNVRIGHETETGTGRGVVAATEAAIGVVT